LFAFWLFEIKYGGITQLNGTDADGVAQFDRKSHRQQANVNNTVAITAINFFKHGFPLRGFERSIQLFAESLNGGLLCRTFL